MPPHTLGLVGLGKIAVDQHLPSIAADPRFTLAAVVDRRGTARPGVPSFRSQDEMLAALPDLDAVAICTPPEVRHELVRAALAAGKHVLMEKPPTATLGELYDLVRAAAAAERTLFATWHSQFNPAVEAARERLAGRRVRAVDVVWREDVRRWHPGQEWIWRTGGFGVFDPGINAFSILTRVLPFPIFVTAAALDFPAGRATPIAARVTFRAPAEAGVERFGADLDWRQEGEQTWTIAIETADGERLELTHGGTRLTVDGAVVLAEADAEYPRIYARFAALLAAGESDVDAEPLRLVGDAMMVGLRREVAPFDW